MFLLNSCLGLFPAAPSRGRPFSLGYGTILPSSLAVLHPSASGSSPHPPVSVYGTGARGAIAAFLGTGCSSFATRSSLRLRLPGTSRGFFLPLPGRRRAGDLLPPADASPMRPRSSGHAQCRNLRLLSIGYASRPRLRPRLTQGRQASPWKPWIFGRKDSHLPLATHSGILSSRRSTAPHGTASPRRQRSPTAVHKHRPGLRRHVSAPDIFGAGPLG